MSKFEICIRGENFLVRGEDGAPRKTGFYAARFVEAQDTAKAVEKAMDSFRNELKDRVLNDKSDPPTMKVVDLRGVYFFEKTMVFDDFELPGEGFLWDD